MLYGKTILILNDVHITPTRQCGDELSKDADALIFRMF